MYIIQSDYPSPILLDSPSIPSFPPLPLSQIMTFAFFPSRLVWPGSSVWPFHWDHPLVISGAQLKAMASPFPESVWRKQFRSKGQGSASVFHLCLTVGGLIPFQTCAAACGSYSSWLHWLLPQWWHFAALFPIFRLFLPPLLQSLGSLRGDDINALLELSRPL